MLTAMGKHRAGTLLAVAVFGLLMSGCASAQPTAEKSTPTAESSTVEQWASVIAKQKGEWDDWQSKWDSATCSSLAASDGAIDCQIMLTSASYMAQTTAITLSLATTPGKDGFVAEDVPAEIKGLWADTSEAAVAAVRAVEPWDAANCGTDTSDSCVSLSVELERAIDELTSQFDAWAPYM